MVLLVQSLICLSYIYETCKYTFIETAAAAKHRLQTLQRAEELAASAGSTSGSVEVCTEYV